MYCDDYARKSHASYTLSDLLKGNDIEIVAASLILLGKLKVDSVQLYRNQPIIAVSLLGEFRTLKESKVNEMTDFLEKNGDMTLDEIIDGIKKKMAKDQGDERGR